MAAATTDPRPLGLTSSPQQPAPPPTAQARWPSLPTNLISLLNPFAQASSTSNDAAGDPTHPAATTQRHESELATLKRPALSAVQRTDMSASTPPSPVRSSTSVMFAEPETRSTSDDGSRDGSVSDAKRARKSTRPKTRYSICHPVPESKVKQKLHRQPRSLLQLHRLQPNARPLPALEVIPSANFSVRLTRAITKVFQSKHGFCVNDLVVLKAEQYGTQEEEAEARDVIGLICKGSREEQKTGSGKMLIHMASGQQWQAYSTSSGGYECCLTDEHGLKEVVRWVPKKKKDGKLAPLGSRKFNFSTISPHSRRHPVIATLQKTGLEISDSYKIPKPTIKSPLSSPKIRATVLEDALDEDADDDDQVVVTDDATREIVTLTAIWVAMREGWSPNFKYDDKRDSLPIEPPASPGKFAASPVISPPASPAPFAPVEKRASIRSIGSGIVHRASHLGRSNRNSVSSIRADSDAESPAPSRNASIHLTSAGRTRADSSSTVLVHRAASNRRKRTEALRENSLEDLTISDSKRAHVSVETPRKPQSAASAPLAKRSVGDEHSSESDLSDGENDTSPPAATGRSRSGTSEDKAGHRMSTTTEDTKSTRRNNHPPVLEMRAQPKRRGWRRLLICGSSKAR
ncbi:hypothetical protein CERZMDRAFT_94856 [Cercospora zeae-maydis SCOH1-5]|uniref:Uncharacterized protein n=1 Tax=Cercospora zeae-maydis SCOH1-5 TaxID=717836 RepID=A0A6A6FPP7_9PEZI|nr:hypothetical protein CERZMDRAFT_94856 [Cercospora zeae-maydis SCOH1-5]